MTQLIMNAVPTPPPRKLPTAQIAIVILLTFVALFPFTVNLHPFSYEYSSTKPQLIKPTVANSSREIKKEIESLEHDLESLQTKFVGLTKDMKKQIKETKATNINGEPAGGKEKKASNPKEKEEFPNVNIAEGKPDRFADFEDREAKQWWIKADLFGSSPSSGSQQIAGRRNLQENDNLGAIIPSDLSVNHLQLVDRAPGSPYTDLTVNEDFLPVVLQSDITFRWRSRARPQSLAVDGLKSTAYQIIARQAYSDGDETLLLWDSGKVNSPDGLPDVVKYDGSKMEIGSLVEWKVTLWDSSQPDGKSSSSKWSKFAVGPSQADWKGKWISHPIDIESWDETDASAFWSPVSGTNGTHSQRVACRNWEKRSQLPIFRAKLPPMDIPEDDEIATALLVVSGLGSFRASFDGKPLSSSGPLDPPLTDFAQRVSYRGFDVTPYFSGESAENVHVVGISMGSGMCSMKWM